ncbi:MAG TPA: type II toxin-antitoxin system death-on-curing family toxin [Gemmatimonadaceae bacterium]|nr:type II toxin-antitoxin system death-on-curing family toxin [Gemmatimonadaceae bacterium]
MPRREPKWLTREHVEAIHDLVLAQHGGLRGIRDAGALESALGRPRHRWQYDDATDVAACGAAYGFGIARNHAFSDGNKRTAFVTMATFLAINSVTLNAAESDAVATMLGVAAGKVSEPQLAQWLRDNSTKPRRRTGR